MVDDSPATHDVLAREASIGLVLPVPTLREHRQQDASLVLATERHFVFRARLLSERLAADPALAVDVRAAAMLKMLGHLYGKPNGRSLELNVRMSQSDLADWLGLRRQRTNFALKVLEGEGLIKLQYSTLTILDPQGLAARAGD